MVLEDERLNKAVLLVLSNKQDIPGAVSTAELSEILGLTERRRETAWSIQVVIMGHSCKTGNVRYGGTSKTQN